MKTERDCARFLEIARGSASQVRYLLSIARRLGFIGTTPAEALEDDYDHVMRALHNFRRGLTSGARGR